MKLDELLRTHPWVQTRDALCAQPSELDVLPIGAVSLLLVQQRDSQIEALQQLMFSPVLDTSGERSSDQDPSSTGPRDLIFELRSPRRTARLFIDRVARAGKDLHRFDMQEFLRVDPALAGLGQLLKLLGIAQNASATERREMRKEWSYLDYEATEVGPVLTPMLHPPQRSGSDFRVRSLENELTQALRQDSADSLTRSGSLPQSIEGTLTRWTGSLVREGSERLRELRGEKK